MSGAAFRTGDSVKLRTIVQGPTFVPAIVVKRLKAGGFVDVICQGEIQRVHSSRLLWEIGLAQPYAKPKTAGPA